MENFKLEEDDVRLLVGSRAEFYLAHWQSALNGVEESFGRNWAAFFFSGLWFPYRKMYKATFILSFNEGIFAPDFKTGTFENDQKFLENLCVFSLILEGIFFYSSFAVMFGFQRQHKLTGSAEQIQYIMRDESMHLNFGCQLINTIREENPQLWTTEFQQKIVHWVREAARLEYTYAQEVFPNGIFGMNAQGFRQYIEHIADRRLERVGLPKQFGVENPFPWMSEAIDLAKEKNFFETRVTEYKVGGALNW